MLSPFSADTGMNVTSCRLERAGELGELLADLVEALLAVADEVHLVDADHEVGHAEQRHQQAVPAGLLEDALAGVDEDDGEVGGRGAGDHVARVLDVAGAVGDDEVARRRREVAVGDVDRDALLALGAQPVRQQGEVDVVVAASLADGGDVLQLILEDRLRVVQQAPDQGRLAVVDGADGGEAQRRGAPHQKYPSRLRSSIPASEMRSSARVAPRSVIRATAVSATTSATVVAAERTAAVHVASPIVRKRTPSR